MGATAAAAWLVLTVTRTNSEPARAKDFTCCTVDSTSAVSVLVIDCTTMGAVPPTRTEPTVTQTEGRRAWSMAVANRGNPPVFYRFRAAGCSALRGVKLRPVSGSVRGVESTGFLIDPAIHRGFQYIQ